jgi:hypothetical protein
MKSAVAELMSMVDAPNSEASALALMEVLYGCQLTMPSGVTLNGPYDEPIGREEAAQIAGAWMGALDPITLKVAFNSRSHRADAKAIARHHRGWRRRLRAAGVMLVDW